MLRPIATLIMVLVLTACGQEPPEPEPQAPAAEPEVEPAPPPVVESVDSEPPAIATVCTDCHGVTAPSPFDDIPTIHGLPAMVIENALYDFRARTRPCRSSACSDAGTCPDTDMCEVTANLDVAEIGLLAGWFAAAAFMPANQPHDPTLAERGRELHLANCEGCHADGGTTSIEQASLLRGQPKTYLRHALGDYRLAERQAVIQMEIGLEELADEDIDALIEFYASPVQAAP